MPPVGIAGQAKDQLFLSSIDISGANMKMTSRDKLWLSGKEIQTSGSYSFEKDSKLHYCKCPTEIKVNHWPEDCRVCGKRSRI